MALFKSEEEREQKRLEKEQALLEKYGLQNLTNADDIESVRKIALSLIADGWYETSSMFHEDEKLFIKMIKTYDKAMLEQNFIIIRQLDRIYDVLCKLETK